MPARPRRWSGPRMGSSIITPGTGKRSTASSTCTGRARRRQRGRGSDADGGSRGLPAGLHTTGIVPIPPRWLRSRGSASGGERGGRSALQIEPPGAASARLRLAAAGDALAATLGSRLPRRSPRSGLHRGVVPAPGEAPACAEVPATMPRRLAHLRGADLAGDQALFEPAWGPAARKEQIDANLALERPMASS